MVKFSIVVPVYNVERYLPKCIESILGQTYKDYELILVNDGSTDQSGLICNKFNDENENICVIHKENGGLSDARNSALTKAKGEYLVFVDSDDYIELYALDNFNRVLEKKDNPDVLITQMKKIYRDAQINYMDKNIPVETMKNGIKNDVVSWLFCNSDNTWPAVRYVVKRSLIVENKLKFIVGYLHEDLDWTSQLFLYATTFTYSDYYWYNHRVGREGSITTKINSKRTLDVIELVSKNIKDSKYGDININLRNMIFERMVKSVFSSLSDYKHYSNADKKEIIKSLYNNQDIFEYTSVFRHKIFINFCKIFGFRAGLLIMNLVHSV